MRLDDDKERQYYIKEASSQNWSSQLLERNIKSGYYRRLLSSKQYYLQEIKCETDLDSVGFYKNLGFACKSFQSKYGVRYNCHL